jgi:hypothetical protein
MKKSNLSKVPFDRVSTWLGLEPEGKDGETWKVWLLNNAKTHSYVKIPNNPISIISELAAAQVGRAINIKIPSPYIVYIDPGEIPEDSRFHGKNITLGFGSSSCGENSKSFERLINTGQESILNDWNDMEQTLIFDEWIANTDRNLGNLIYDPATKNYWLIDHGRAFADLNSLFAQDNITNHSISVNNDLVNQFKNCDIAYANKLQRLSNQLMIKCRQIELDQLDFDDHYARVNGIITKTQLSNFLIRRIHHTTELICHKIGFRMMRFS